MLSPDHPSPHAQNPQFSEVGNVKICESVTSDDNRVKRAEKPLVLTGDEGECEEEEGGEGDATAATAGRA